MNSGKIYSGVLVDFFFFLVFLLARSVLLYTCLVLNLIIHLADSAVVKYYVETTD